MNKIAGELQELIESENEKHLIHCFLFISN